MCVCVCVCVHVCVLCVCAGKWTRVHDLLPPEAQPNATQAPQAWQWSRIVQCHTDFRPLREPPPSPSLCRSTIVLKQNTPQRCRTTLNQPHSRRHGHCHRHHLAACGRSQQTLRRGRRHRPTRRMARAAMHSIHARVSDDQHGSIFTKKFLIKSEPFTAHNGKVLLVS